jgi:hypothetical protein
MHIGVAAEGIDVFKLASWRGDCEFNTLARFTM